MESYKDTIVLCWLCCRHLVSDQQDDCDNHLPLTLTTLHGSAGIITRNVVYRIEMSMVNLVRGQNLMGGPLGQDQTAPVSTLHG